MKNKTYQLTMKLQPIHDLLPNCPVKVKFPDGCVGVMLAFKDKKSARKFCGNDVILTEVEEVKRG